MKISLKNVSGFVVGGLIASTSIFSNTAVAADYPPSVEVCVVGQELIKPIATKATGTTAVVPVATACVIPIVIGEPINTAAAKLAQKTLTNASLESTPIKLTSSLVLGGIGANEKTPVATFASSKKSEVQFPVDVPTRVVLSGFKPGATGTATFLDSRGKSYQLGKVKVSASGRVTIPALTFAKKNAQYTIKITIAGKTTSFSIRATY